MGERVKIFGGMVLLSLSTIVGVKIGATWSDMRDFPIQVLPVQEALGTPAPIEISVAPGTSTEFDVKAVNQRFTVHSSSRKIPLRLEGGNIENIPRHEIDCPPDPEATSTPESVFKQYEAEREQITGSIVISRTNQGVLIQDTCRR